MVAQIEEEWARASWDDLTCSMVRGSKMGRLVDGVAGFCDLQLAIRMPVTEAAPRDDGLSLIPLDGATEAAPRSLFCMLVLLTRSVPLNVVAAVLQRRGRLGCCCD